MLPAVFLCCLDKRTFSEEFPHTSCYVKGTLCFALPYHAHFWGLPHVTKAAVVRISDAQYFILRFVVGELFHVRVYALASDVHGIHAHRENDDGRRDREG